MMRNNLHYGSLVPAALKGVPHQYDPNLTRINRTIPRMFKRNGLTEGRKVTLLSLFVSMKP